MPAFILHVAIDLDKLLEDGTVASSTLGGEPSGVVEVAVNIILVFVVGILLAKYRGANRAREVFNMILLVWWE